MFTKILIANRGEIAVRIIRTCQEMGIACVAVYSTADATAPHVWLADEAAEIGPAPATESYLRIDKLVEMAIRHGCDAIHPGYGFLAENPDFAAAVTTAGLTWIGPAADTMRIMGSKTAARAAMEVVGVPIASGYQEDGTDDSLVAAAQRIGFPLMVKAAAGGGGKGMRLVQHVDDLAAALPAARREAKQAFGSEQLFLERMIERPRHIEFQIIGDHHGNVVHLFERECSIQRRHQKIIEETPAPHFEESLRQRMGEAAVAAARAVNYRNAGTVEFLVDPQGDFYFLEMNTRLQVEHPITELVTGIDLVRTQIDVAAGQALPFAQRDITQRGNAIECRIYAEDATNGFLPSTGTLDLVKEPIGPGIRVDSGVVSGSEISHYYDPMLAKLIVSAVDRHAALQKMQQALRQFIILGEPVTNIAFLQAVLAHSAFMEGSITTDFLERHFADWSPMIAAPPDEVLIAAVIAELLREPSYTTNGQPLELHDPHSPWQHIQGFRLGAVQHG